MIYFKTIFYRELLFISILHSKTDCCSHTSTVYTELFIIRRSFLEKSKSFKIASDYNRNKKVSNNTTLKSEDEKNCMNSNHCIHPFLMVRDYYFVDVILLFICQSEIKCVLCSIRNDHVTI